MVLNWALKKVSCTRCVRRPTRSSLFRSFSRVAYIRSKYEDHSCATASPVTADLLEPPRASWQINGHPAYKDFWGNWWVLIRSRHAYVLERDFVYDGHNGYWYYNRETWNQWRMTIHDYDVASDPRNECIAMDKEDRDICSEQELMAMIQ